MRLYELIIEAKPTYPPGLIDKVRELCIAGKTSLEIANELGEDRGRINNILYKLRDDPEVQQHRVKRTYSATVPPTATRPPPSPETIELIKKLYDQHVSLKDIARQIGTDSVTANNWIMKYHPDRTLRRTHITQDEVDTVEKLYNKNLPYREIARLLDMEKHRVRTIITRYLTDREKRNSSKNPALDDLELIEQVKRLYDDGASASEIAALLDQTKETIITILVNRHPDREARSSGAPPRPQEQLTQMIELYTAGKELKSIADTFNVKWPSSIIHAMKKLPNYAELRKQRALVRDHGEGVTGKPIPNKLIGQVKELTDDGKKSMEISRELNIPYRKARYIQTAILGAPVRKSSPKQDTQPDLSPKQDTQSDLSPREIVLIGNLYRRGMPPRDIANDLGVDIGLIHDVIDKASRD